MNRRIIIWESIGVKAEIAAFAPSDKVAEIHVILHVEPQNRGFGDQWGRICQAEERLMQETELQDAKLVMKRYFLSDAANQLPQMTGQTTCAVSTIQQPCLDGSKIAAWLYWQRGTGVCHQQADTIATHHGYRHIYHMGLTVPQGDSYQQTETLLQNYEQCLTQHHANVADNCIRTWFYVRDVDTQYSGMVKARKELFSRWGLTEHTHYIASTGIGGTPANNRAIVQLDAYALTGLDPQQLRYLYAPTHLNPTYQYGVTFERGTAITYGDRTHLYISGTASIDNQGKVVHVGDIVRQVERMWENVEALLAEGHSSFDDLMMAIVYLRDMGDYQIVKQMFDQKFPHIPTLITLAPVCRPTWLVEMECIAISPLKNDIYRDF